MFLDKFIIKRDNQKNPDGEWSLKKPNKSSSNSIYYANTFNDKSTEEYPDSEYDLKTVADNLLTLQSALRITYTSPKTMHWITKLLKVCKPDSKPNELLKELEKYSIQKLKESNFREKKGFEFDRIVFSYVDYILYRDGNESLENHRSFEFQYRNSIEHFYPQHPISKPECPDSILNSFGNLALITVSGNSKFSNLDPVSKKNSYGNIINQSLKLKIMANLIRDNSDDWLDNSKGIVKKHEEEMFNLLDKEIEKL